MVTVFGVRVNQFGRIQVAAATVLTLIALGGGVVAIGAFALDVAVSEEFALLLVIELLGGLLDEFAVIVEFAEELSGELVVNLGRRAAVDVVGDTEFLKRLLDQLVVAVHHLLRGDALLAGALGNRHTVLVAAAHEHHVLALQTQVAYIDVGRDIHACQMADVDWSVSIGQRRRHQRARKFLLLFHCIVV